MKRTIDIMTTARAKGVELPGKWWGNRIVCPRCGERSTVMGAPFVSDQVWCRKCDGPYGHGKRVPRSRFPEREVYIGPDLERPENIHHAFTVADALGGTPIDIDHFIGDGDSPSGFYFHARWFLPVCKTDRYAEARAPERHLALVAACEAALGIQHDKENT